MHFGSGLRPVTSLRTRLCLVALLGVSANADAAGPEDGTKPDCGVHALFILLRLEGKPVTIDRLDSALPPRRPEGYSMAELAVAARSVGLNLEGVRFEKGDKSLARPAIAFLKSDEGWHFTVLRPVGTTGTMVQVIDPPSAPWIADYDRVLSSKRWTGRILIPREPWIKQNAAPTVAGFVGFVLVLSGIGYHVAKRRTHLDCDK